MVTVHFSLNLWHWTVGWQHRIESRAFVPLWAPWRRATYPGLFVCAYLGLTNQLKAMVADEPLFEIYWMANFQNSEHVYTVRGGELEQNLQIGWFTSRHRQSQQLTWGLHKLANSFNTGSITIPQWPSLRKPFGSSQFGYANGKWPSSTLTQNAFWLCVSKVRVQYQLLVKYTWSLDNIPVHISHIASYFGSQKYNKKYTWASKHMGCQK